MELVEEHAFDFDFGVTSVRHGWWFHARDEEILIVLEAVEPIAEVKRQVLGILLAVARDGNDDGARDRRRRRLQSHVTF